MNNNNNSNIIIIFLTLLVLGLSGYIVYDKVFLNDINENESNNNSNYNDNETSNQNATGKIYIKRDGVASLEKVPNYIVGKYVHSENDYFILNSDGTAITSDDHNFTYQLTYNKNQILVELYDNPSNDFYYSPFMIGTTHTAASGATAILMTPSAMNEKVYIKPANNKENK